MSDCRTKRSVRETVELLELNDNLCFSHDPFAEVNFELFRVVVRLKWNKSCCALKGITYRARARGLVNNGES